MSLTRSNEDRIFKINESPEPTLCVLIVDRDAMSSHLLAEALIRDRRCDTAAVAASDLLRTLAARDTDLVVISADLDAGSGAGFELAEAVHRAHPDMIIVLLLNQGDRESVINAFRSGARGVFSRQRPMTEFLDCIDHVKKGYIWAGREETNFLLEIFRTLPVPGGLAASISPPLTRRELEVVECAATGKTNRAIADQLGLSEHTVKNYLFRAFDKLGISTRGELLFYLTMRGHTFEARQNPDGPSAAPSSATSRSSRQDRLALAKSESEPAAPLPRNSLAGTA